MAEALQTRAQAGLLSWCSPGASAIPAIAVMVALLTSPARHFCFSILYHFGRLWDMLGCIILPCEDIVLEIGTLEFISIKSLAAKGEDETRNYAGHSRC